MAHQIDTSECNVLEKLKNAKEEKEQLDSICQAEMQTYRKEQEELDKEIRSYQNIGDKVAACMRRCFEDANSAYTTSQGSEAKELSEKGRMFEKQARDANATKDSLIQKSKLLKSSMNNSPSQMELRKINAEIKELQDKLEVIQKV
jgi:aromatic ring hydroxylase